MIRKVVRDDEKHFIEVYRLAYRGLEDYAYTSRRDIKWYFRWLLKRDPDGFYTYVVDVPIGFVACDCNWFGFEGEIAEIHEIFVHPKWQGRGIGKALMNVALRYAVERGMDKVELWVGVGNYRAIRFYKGFGFEERGTFGRWLRMVKSL